ncbi:ABC transporter substrate-binding protein [Amycolatopsis sp. GM8]|uniref:ABC transporter substrate-binding protein n=1 Tax=Amycolatopsis sp. GM8 TaxID=2896530 RepID=UPI002104BA7A|nr:ABC transporter substrate-binding protein [Amycolatopsis sp. GM8]
MASTAAVLAATLTLAACGSSGNSDSNSAAQANSANGSAITIGIIARLTGVGSDSYAGTKPAATAWEKWVNANGGLNGHQVKVVIEDSGGDAGKGLSQTRDLVENQGAVAIMPVDSSTDTALGSYTTGKGVPVISPFNSYPLWYKTIGWFPLGIQSVPDGNNAALHVIKDSGATSVAAAVCAESAACGSVDGTMRDNAPSIGLRYDGAVKLDAAAPNYTAQCLSLKSKGTDVVFYGASGQVSVKFASNCAQQGFTPKAFFPYHAFNPAATKIPNLDALATEPTVPWYADVPATKTFRDAMSKYGDMSKNDETSMFVWSTLEAIRVAAGKAGGDGLTRDSLKAGLYQFKNENLGGLIAPVTFVKDQLPAPVKCYFAAGYKDGKYFLPEGADPKCLPS